MADNSNLLDLDIVLRLPQPKDFAKELQVNLGRAAGDALTSAVRQYQDAQFKASEKIDKKLSDLALRSLRRGMATDELGKIAKAYGEINQEKIAAFTKIKLLEEQLQNATNKAEREAFQTQLDHAKALFEYRSREAKREYSNIIKHSLDHSGKIAGAVSEAFNAGVIGGLEKIKSGDLEGIATGLSTAFQGAFAKGAQILAGKAEGARSEGKEGMAAGLEGAAQMMATLSKAAMVMSLVAASLAALLAIVGQADEQFKQMNRTLIEGSGALEFVAGGYQNLSDNLANIRDVVTDFGLNIRLGTTAEELNALVTVFARFGSNNQVLDSMNTMDNLRNSLTEITTYARLSGETMDSMATSFSEYGDRMRMSLSDVASAFSSVLDNAMASGVGVNRFQSFVFQATANAALYNKRLEETASLLGRISKFVDFETATNIITSSGGRYEGMSTQDRIQSVLTTDRRAQTQIFENEFRSAIRDLGPQQSQEIEAGLISALAAQGLSTEGGIEGMLATLNSASAEQQRAVRSAPELVQYNQTVSTLAGLQRAASGNQLDRASNLDLLSNTGAFAYRLAEGRSIVGNTPLERLSIQQRMALESMGMTPEEFRQLSLLETPIVGEYERAQAAQQSGDLNALRSLGLTLGDQGELVSLSDGGLIDSFQDYIMMRGLPELNEEVEVARDIALLGEIAVNTQSFADVIQNGITAILNDIYTELSPFLRMASRWIQGIFSGDEEPSLAERISDERDRVIEERQILMDQLQEARRQRSQIEEGVDTSALDAFIEQIARQAQEKADNLSALSGIRDEESFNRYIFGTRRELVSLQVRRERLVEEREQNIPRSRNPDLAWALYPTDIVDNSHFDRLIEEVDEQIAIHEDTNRLEEESSSTLNRILQAIEEQQQEARRRELIEFLGNQGFQGQHLEDAMRNIAEGNFGGFSPNQRSQLAAMGIPVNDFIYQSTGSGSRITPINSQDQFYGAKPGGPIANAINNQSSNQNVVINIHGASTNDVVRTLDTYLRAKGIRANRPIGKRM